MNAAARLGFSSSRTRLEHAARTNRIGAIVLALTLAGCKTQWDRWDDDEMGSRFDVEATRVIESKISTFRPGQMSLSDVEAALGGLDPESKPLVIGQPDTTTVSRTWNSRARGWWFRFTLDAQLKSMGRMWYTYSFVDFGGDESREYSRWHQDRRGMHPVASEVAETFCPGRTSQADAIAAWGPCIRAQLRDDDRFEMCWGADEDCWTLLFDDSGVLAGEPKHYVSNLAKK